MSNKTKDCYEDVFNYIHRFVMDLDCASFTTDYERAMRNALKNLFPNAELFACFFHYTQAVKKHAYKTIGLVQLIRSNAQARSVYFRLQCLPLLPAKYISDMFQELKAEAYKIDRAVFKPFMKYFHLQWILRVCVAFHLCIIFEHKIYKYVSHLNEPFYIFPGRSGKNQCEQNKYADDFECRS